MIVRKQLNIPFSLIERSMKCEWSGLMPSVRKIALDVLLKVEKNKSYSNLLVNSYLEKGNLPERDAAFLTALVYGVLENAICLDYFISHFASRSAAKLDPPVRTILRMGAYQLIFLTHVPSHAAVSESVELAKKCGAARASGFINAVLRKIAVQAQNLPYPDKDRDLKRYLHVRYSCPQWLLDKWISEYGIVNAEGILSGLERRPAAVLRANTLKTTASNLKLKLAEEDIHAEVLSFPDNALKVDRLPELKRSPAFTDGLFIVQNTASQICCFACGAKPGDMVIDMCAAPGGKSFTMAFDMRNDGNILSLEFYEARLKLIEDGARRLSIDIINTKLNDASKHNDKLGLADVVLCDVPCSGLGVIGRKPEIRYKNPVEFDELPNLQYSILCEGASHVKLGGRLVYSTCTLSRAENDEVIARFLESHKEFIPDLPAQVKAIAGCEFADGPSATLMPHITGTDGFFISAFKRSF